MDEKEWELLATWAHGTKPATIIYHDVICALLDLHERMKEVQMIQLNLLGRVSHIEGYQKQRYGMASFQSYHERLEKLEKMLPITMDALNREKDMMERLEIREKRNQSNRAS